MPAYYTELLHKMKMLKLPETQQTYNYDCGAKSLQAVLAYYGIYLREEILMKDAGTTKTGTPILGIVKAAKKYKLKVKSKRMTIDEIKKFLDKNIPVILDLQAWSGKQKINWKDDWKDGHYVIAIGYDRKKIYFDDPFCFQTTFLTFKEIEARWHDIDSKKVKHFSHGIAIYGKKPEFNPRKIEHME